MSTMNRKIMARNRDNILLYLPDEKYTKIKLYFLKISENDKNFLCTRG